MFILNKDETISASCGTASAINLSLFTKTNKPPLPYGGEEGTGGIDNIVFPLPTSTTVIFTADIQTLITHIVLTNVTGSTVTGVNVYLNTRKVISNVLVKGNTTVTLSTAGFTQYPLEPSLVIYTGSGGEWGTFTGDIQTQTDLVDGFQARVITLTAGETISSGMAVVIWTDNQVYKYDITDDTHAGLTCGIAKTSGTVGNPMDVTLTGSIHTEVGSGWAAGNSYYIAATSLLTTTPPVVGIVKKIATGLSADTVFINDYNEFITI